MYPSCGGKRYGAFLRTIFDDSKKDLPTLIFFIELMWWNVPLGGIAKICKLNHKIAYEWRQRVFAAVDAFGQARKRGLSKQKLCIAVAIDACKNVVVGHGKPSRVSGIACECTSPRGVNRGRGHGESRTGPWSGWSKACTRPTGHTSVTRNTSSAWLS